MKQKPESVHYVYMAECCDGSLYTGWTTDVEERIKMHNSGRGAKYTRSRLPVRLVYWERLSDKSEALKRECAIKKLRRGKKEALIRSQMKNEG